MKARIHGAVAVLAWLFIAVFWTSTLVAELFLSNSAVAVVKSGIAHALAVFVPLMAFTAGSGFSLAGRRTHPLLLAKRRRMPFIAINGLLILLPAALWLHAKAQAGEFDAAFYAVQALELGAGLANLVLMGMNIRDGLGLSSASARRQ